MDEVIANDWSVFIYVAGCFSLAWHLLHGFQSAFQTLGWKNRKYATLIERTGIAYAIIVPLIFALMPIFMYFNIEIPIGNLTLLF